MGFEYLNRQSFLRALPINGFARIDFLAGALKDAKSFNQRVFPVYNELRKNGLEDKRIRNAIIEANYPLAEWMARKFDGYGGLEFDDYLSEAGRQFPGLVERYDGRCEFSTFFCASIRYQFYNLLKRKGLIHIPFDLFPHLDSDLSKLKTSLRARISKANQARRIMSVSQPVREEALRKHNVSLWEKGNYAERRREEYVAAKHDDPVLSALKNERNNILRKILSSFDERTAEIMRRYYGIRNDRPEPLSKIADSFRVTTSRAGQIHLKAIGEMQKILRAFKLGENDVLEIKDSCGIVVCQEFSELRKYSRMMDDLRYYANFVSEFDEFAEACKHDLSLCIVKTNIFEVSPFYLAKFIRENRSRPFILFTYNSEKGEGKPKKLPQFSESFDVKEMSIDSRPEELEQIVRNHADINEAEIEHSLKRLNIILRA